MYIIYIYIYHTWKKTLKTTQSGKKRRKIAKFKGKIRLISKEYFGCRRYWKFFQVWSDLFPFSLGSSFPLLLHSRLPHRPSHGPCLLVFLLMYIDCRYQCYFERTPCVLFVCRIFVIPPLETVLHCIICYHMIIISTCILHIRKIWEQWIESIKSVG